MSQEQQENDKLNPLLGTPSKKGELFDINLGEIRAPPIIERKKSLAYELCSDQENENPSHESPWKILDAHNENIRGDQKDYHDQKQEKEVGTGNKRKRKHHRKFNNSNRNSSFTNSTNSKCQNRRDSKDEEREDNDDDFGMRAASVAESHSLKFP